MNIETLARDIEMLVPDRGGRLLLGLAGPPASGKSTLAARLAGAVGAAAQVLPMDGFHLDDRILNARGDRARKGAPHTFDAAGFAAMLRRVRTEAVVYAPAFDRDLELSRAAAIEIGPETRVVIVEGNYLLHGSGGWEAVRPLLDQCWYLDVPEAELRRRLLERWRGQGLSQDEVVLKVEGNDLPNAHIVLRTQSRADRILRGDGLRPA